MPREVMSVYTIGVGGEVTSGAVIDGYSHRRSEGEFPILGVGEKKRGAWIEYLKVNLTDSTYDTWNRGMDTVRLHRVTLAEADIAEYFRRKPHERYVVCETNEEVNSSEALIVVRLPVEIGLKKPPFGRGDEVLARGRLQGPDPSDKWNDGGKQVVLIQSIWAPITFPLHGGGTATYRWGGFHRVVSD